MGVLVLALLYWGFCFFFHAFWQVGLVFFESVVFVFFFHFATGKI